MRAKARSSFRFGVVLATLLLTAAAPSETTLEARLREALLGKKPARQTSAFAIDVRTGKTIFAHGEETPLIPASNAKLWATAAAMEILGADYEFTTRLVGRGRLEGEAWVGDLKVIGGGDPCISERFHPGRPAAVLEGWAKHLAARGIRSVTGDLLLDDGFFDRVYRLPAWPKDDPSKAFMAPMGGLSFNENCVDLLIAPGGGGVVVTPTPKTGYIDVVNTATITGDRKKHLIRVSRPVGTNRFNIGGRVWKKSGGYRGTFSVHDPTLYFGTVFREVLQGQGIRIQGEVRRAPGKRGGGDGKWTNLDLHRSSLKASVELANRKSQNFHAEQIFKTLGREKGGEGSFAAASKVVEEFLRGLDLPAASFDVQDGSGLSRKNRVSAQVLVRLLRHMAVGPHGEFYLSTLAASGDPSGTLKKRLRSEKTKGNVRAKTGSLRGVSALSGFVFTPEKEIVAFSILMNGTSSLGAARQAQDRFCTVLLDYVSD